MNTRNRIITIISLSAVLLSSATALWPMPAAHAQAKQGTEAREIEIIVKRGYHPNKIVITEGEKVRLKFVRQEHTSCTREVVFPALGIRKELPPNQPVIIELPALAPGEYEFRCGMNMVKGTLIVQPRA